MEIIECIKKLCRQKTDEEAMMCELKAANRERIQALKAIEYAASLLQYHKARIAIIEEELASLKGKPE